MLKDVLREARNAQRIKQEDIAKIVGVAKQTYLKWENGSTEPKASQVVKLADTLNISTSEICRGKLNVRYSLQDFIMEMQIARPSPEIKALITWEHICDHGKFIKELANPTIDTFHNAHEVAQIESNRSPNAMIQEE